MSRAARTLRLPALLLAVLAAAFALLPGSHAADAQTAAPAVTGLEVSSTPASGDTYLLGETIRVTVTFSETVDVTGAPRLKIDMDPAYWGEKWAAYESGTGTASLTFAHEVVEPNYSTQGIAVLANTLELNGGTVRSASSQTDAALAHTGLDHDADHRVDWQRQTTTTPPKPKPALAPEPTATPTPEPTAAPTPAPAPSVTGVEVSSTSGADQTYALGETIRVTLTFSEAVDVTGAPRLAIDMDPAFWGEKQAGYESGSGTASLTFAHEVVEPNYSTQGIAVLANTLELNGGTVRSASSQTDAALAHSGLAHDADHKVDWRRSASPDCALAAPSSVRALGIQLGAVVSWTLPEDLDDTCQVSGFTVAAISTERGLGLVGLEALIIDPDARSHTLRGLDPGDYHFSVRIDYAQGASEELVTAQQNSVPDACITFAVEPYSRTAISGSITSVNGTGCLAREEFDIQIKRAQDDHWRTLGRFTYNEGGQPNPDLPDFIFYGRKPYVGYDFRIVAYDASGSSYATTKASATIVSDDPSAVADTGSPPDVRVYADNSSGALVKWGEYTTPTGRTATGMVVEWKACSTSPIVCSGAAMTAVVPVNENNGTNWKDRRFRITGLTDGTYYTVRVAARTHQSGDTTMTTSDAWSVPQPVIRAWSEPTQLWFVDATPDHNAALGRTFMTSATNKEWGAFTCHLMSTGAATGEINCPLGTLVSLEAGGTITAHIARTEDDETETSEAQGGAADGPVGFQVRASAGAEPSDNDASTNEGKIVVAWDEGTEGASTIGTIDAYIIQHRSGTSGAWTDTTKAATDTSHTLTGLTNGTWQVRVRARTDGDDGDPNTTDTARFGFTSEVMEVTVNAAHTAALDRPVLTVTPGDSASLIVEWELPRTGSIPYQHQVRHRLKGTSEWTESEVLTARQTRRICSNAGECANPRRHEITGLTGGEEYYVEVRVRNANGWGAWGAAWPAIPND